MDEIIREFLVESQENLTQVEQDLMALEKDPGSTEKLSSIFRVVHSIKGSVGFLGFLKLGAVAHAGENLLSRLRDGSLRLTRPIADGLLALLDAMREMVAQIETTGRDGDRDYAELIDRLIELQASSAVREPSRSEKQPLGDAATDPDVTIILGEAAAGPVSGETVALFPQTSSPARPEATSPPVPVFESAPLFPDVPPAAPRRVAPVLNPPPPVASAAAEAPEAGSTGSSASVEASLSLKAAPPSVADSTIRVDVSLLEQLMSLVGELVLARNQILQHTARYNDSAFQATSQRLNAITTELQERMMKTRMQPIGTVWSKLPRMVRDLATGCGKRVQVLLEGEGTELDKTVIEAIRDPLTHLVRNAIDHGIEAPERRATLGKPLEGVVSLRAFHEGGQVGIEITDDGSGIDPERIKRTAIERGLIAHDQAARMTDQELVSLIFRPGFTTAEQISLVSGRGVGMDVVKTGIEKIGGSIDVQSQVGQGTAIKIKIPLTLAIIKVLLVTCGGERFAIPQVNLIELVRLDGETALRGLERVQGAAVYRYRGRLLPLIDLRAMLTGEEGPSRALGRDGEPVHLVVLQPDGHPFGLVVDRVNDSQEIVVRPLAKQLRSIACFEGATILGDGKVALILDASGLARLAGVTDSTQVQALPGVAGPPSARGGKRRPMLLLQSSHQSRVAIPLEQVARLERFPRSAIARLGPGPVVPYRGEILTLIDLAAVLSGQGQAAPDPAPDTRERETVPVVVCSEHGQRVGLVCEAILDIIDEPIDAQGEDSREAVLHTALVQDRVTEVLDLAGLLRERARIRLGSTAGSQRGEPVP